MKKLIISFIFFFSFFNGVLNSVYSDTKLYETNEATIEVDSARIDKDNFCLLYTSDAADEV